jgi:hypothetical protein
VSRWRASATSRKASTYAAGCCPHVSHEPFISGAKRTRNRVPSRSSSVATVRAKRSASSVVSAGRAVVGRASSTTTVPDLAASVANVSTRVRACSSSG